jgi:signal transduction histidine kinase
MSADTHRDNPETRAMTDAAGIRAYLEVPVRIGDTFGIFVVAYKEPHSFTEGERRLFESLAQRASLAIENARLYERSQQAASLEERQRLARELHDSVSQALYGIALGARTARTLLDRDPARATDPMDYVLSLAEAGLAEMRALIFELRPESLESEGLVAALEKQVAATRARYGIEVRSDFGEEPEAALELKEVLYRIGQEALHNTVKHARATEVEISLAAVNGDIRLSGSGPRTYAGSSTSRARLVRAQRSQSWCRQTTTDTGWTGLAVREGDYAEGEITLAGNNERRHAGLELR